MTRLTAKLLLGFCLCLCFTAVRAQYRIDQWTADSGLPQNSVYGITQTRDGYLWLATVDGLVRFDGVRFTVFNKSNSPGIENNRFLSLYENAKGGLWAVTEVNIVTLYYQGRFSSYPVEMAADTSFPFLINEDIDGTPFTVANDFRTAFLREGKFTLFDPPAYSAKNVPAYTGNKIFQCQTDQPNNRIQCLVGGRLLNLTMADGLPMLQQVASDKGAEDRNGDFWLGFSQPEAQLLRFKQGRLFRSYGPEDGLQGEPYFFVPGARRLSLMSKDAKGALWLTDLDSMRSELVTRQLPEWFQNVLTAYEDREGSIWVGTLRGGLFRLRKQFITAYSKAEGLFENIIYPIYEDTRGDIWAGAYPGLYKFENGRFYKVKSGETFISSSLGETSDGRLLACHYDKIFVLDKGELKPFFTNPFGITQAIHTDRDGSIWFGGVGGLVRVNNEEVKTFTMQDRLAANDVKIIIEDGANGLWIGSYGGLTHYKDGQFTKWTENEGLPTPTIRSLYLDGEGTLWIGSYDSGMARFKDGKFTHYTTKHGLFNDGAFQILEDGRRNFWISSNRGIYRINKDELNEFAEGRRTSITSIAYGKSDGMLNVECNGGRSPGGVKTRDGRLWFPTQDGVAVIDPETVPVNEQPPPVVIESVKIDNREALGTLLGDSESNEDGFQAADPKTDIRIEPHQQNFEIQYTGISFINSENLRFKYKLDGLNNDWIDAGTRRTAYFSNVPPGEYTFRVIAANADGIWNETGAELPLTVLPPFYRTWWFTAFAVLAVLGAVFLLYWRRVSELKSKHALQQAFSRRLIDSQEQERKRFAAELHDGLGQSLVIVKNLARLSLRRSEDQTVVVEHLEKISSTASHAIEETREIAFNLRPHLLDRLGLTRTIESMLDKVFGAGGIRYETRLDPIDDVFPDESEILFYRIIQECASNIVKHAKASEAKVVIRRGLDSLHLTISDNGIGFDPSAIGSDLKKRSFGLVGISERTRLLGGKLNIDSRPGKGTKVEMYFDL